MKYHLVTLLLGILFGVGLSLSHMIDPDRVLDFLDITGRWDPSLLFVMMGALPLAIVTFKWVLKRPKPIWAEQFQLPKKTVIDRTLIIGATTFGIGWGMSGYCPGPAVASLGTMTTEAFIMIVTIYLGFFAYTLFDKRKNA